MRPPRTAAPWGGLRPAREPAAVPSRSRKRDLALLAFLLILAAGGLATSWLDRRGPAPPRTAMLRASSAMEEALAALREEAVARGIPTDPALDPSDTGLVGLEWSGLSTTLGSLPAKRTGVQAEAAALFARLYREAGLGEGDLVAIDSSGSFPGFAVAAAVAAESLGCGVRMVVSLGSSSWGANRPDYTLCDIMLALDRRGVLPFRLVAVSAGGAADRGKDLDPAVLSAALGRAAAAGLPILVPGSLAEAIGLRMAALGAGGGAGAAGAGDAPGAPGATDLEAARPAILVSTGGNWSSTGEGGLFPPRNGLILPGSLGASGPPGEGLVQAFLRAGLPVIRIIDVAGLCAATGLPFDPRQPPPRGSSALYRGSPASALAAGLTIALAFAVLVLFRIEARRPLSRRAPSPLISGRV